MCSNAPRHSSPLPPASVPAVVSADPAIVVRRLAFVEVDEHLGGLATDVTDPEDARGVHKSARRPLGVEPIPDYGLSRRTHGEMADCY